MCLDDFGHVFCWLFGRIWPIYAAFGRFGLLRPCVSMALDVCLVGFGHLRPSLACFFDGLGRLWPEFGRVFGRLWPTSAAIGHFWQCWGGFGLYSYEFGRRWP